MSITLSQNEFADLYNTATIKLPNGKKGLLICTFKENESVYKATFNAHGVMYPVMLTIIS